MATHPKLYWIHLDSWPIFKQLELEEALLRGGMDNFCILNQGSTKTIVMGISGDEHKLIDLEKVKKQKVPLLRRFSGGGTVIVDKNTLFITFIMNHQVLPFHPFPEPILRWTEGLYQKSWQIPHFHLRENDYCILDKKCGGNAQYIKKDRWLHHSSFLWDFSPCNMELLLLPEKRPKYRESRSHLDFLTQLKKHTASQEELIEKLHKTLEDENFLIEKICPESLTLSQNHRKSLRKILH